MTKKSNINPALSNLIIPISEVKEDPKNARLHDARNLKSIAKSLEKYGQQKAIVTQNGFVIAGNGTLAAVRDLLGWDEIAAVPYHQSEESARGYKIADNRT